MVNGQIAYIGLGSNEGDRAGYIKSAMNAIGRIEDVQLLRTSEVIETPAMGFSTRENFLNAVAEVQTILSAGQLFEVLQSMEGRLGRVRGQKWGPRTIDLDLLLYGDKVISERNLCVPHRQAHLRTFVLNGLVQLCPERVHPVLKQDMTTLKGRLNGRDYFLEAARPQLISIAGLIGVGKTTLMKNLAECLGGEAVYEEFDKNPYLAEVYAGAKELALDSELYFLSSSVRQHSSERLKAGRIYINDYVFEKALVYARSWLQPPQLAEYEKIYPQQHQKAVRPVLVIYLEDTAQNCLERIHRRRRPYEQSIQLDFLKGLQMWYNELFKGWTTCPAVRINAGQCRTIQQVQTLANEIRCYLATKEDDLCNWFIQ